MMLPVMYIVRRTWTVFLVFQLQMICIRGDCGPPPVIEHTLPVEEKSGLPGDTVIYTCDRSTGYYEVPNKSRTVTCQDDGTWTSVSDFCARACGVPERFDFAVPNSSDLEKDIYLPGTTVRYDCRPGYRPVPGLSRSVTCLDNYVWSEASKFCTLRSCGHPGEIENGDFEATNQFFFSSKVTYRCNEGYHLSSRRNYRDCLANGQWSNAVPQCDVDICPAPDRPVNGKFSPEKDEYNYLDAVTFTCNNGLHVIGESSASCLSNATWSNSSPTCTAVACQDPGQITNGRKISGFVGPYTLNSAVRYECENTFAMNGSSSITCNVNSLWEPELPKCLSVCSTPPTYPFAVLEERFANIYYYNTTTVFYTCKTGYETVPNSANGITCLGRSWSTLDKFCSPIFCGEPGEVPYAKRLGSQFTFGSRVNYECQDRYVMTSSISYRECQADGSWSTGDIICSATCQIPEVANSHLKLGSKRVYVQLDVVVIECEKDYVLSGSSTITCSSRGQWEPSLPECTKHHSGLSVGAIVGIVIGCLVVIVGILLCCCCCTKKNSGKPKSDTPDVRYTACTSA